MKALTEKITVCRAQDPLLPEISYGLKISGGASDASQTLREADRQMYTHKGRRKALKADGAPEDEGRKPKGTSPDGM
jgi:hypothetical protein